MTLGVRAWVMVSAVFVAVDGGQLGPRITPTGVVAGVVVSADAARAPIRRVTVTLSGGNMVNALAVTGDDGRFEFRSLAAGRYTLGAARPGFITTSFGATKPGRAGTAIALAYGQQVTNLRIPLVRGGVISGAITDDRGEPARNVRVGAVPINISAATGRRTLQPGLSAGFALAGLPAGGEAVDDRGAFRIYGLAPGEYAIVALLSHASAGVPETSEAEFQRAVQQVRSGASAVGPTSPARSTGAPARATATTPVFFPGTFLGAQARFISLGPAEEVTGINFGVRVVPTARITGSVVGSDGRPASGIAVRLTSGSGFPVMGPSGPAGMTSDREGRFTIAGVSPGTYVVGVQPAPAPGGGPTLWAHTNVTVDGRDVDASLVLQHAVQVSGNVMFESHGALTPPADGNGVRVALMAVPAEDHYVPNPAPGTTRSAGAFVVAGVTPGRFRFQITPPGGTPGTPGWFVKSITIQGRDILDASLPIAAADVAGVRITLTDRPIEVSGTIQDASGRPAPEYFLIAFPRNRALWTAHSPRIQQVKPGTDGTYLLRGLLPGEYLIAAATDVQPGELYDPAFLGHLLPTPIVVVDGDKKVLNLRVK